MSAVVCRYAVTFGLFRIVFCQGHAVISFNSSAAYSGETVVLTCNYQIGVLLSASVDAFNGTRNEGYLWCDVNTLNTSGKERLAFGRFIGCPFFAGVKSFSLTLPVTPMLELDYNCSATVFDNGLVTVMSGPAPLKVLLCPLPVKFQQRPVVFNDTDNGTIACESLYGKPAAIVSLVVSNSNGAMLSTSGYGSAILVLSSPLADWHNATATCNVTNHNCPNMTETTGVFINYITIKMLPDVVHTNEHDTILDCSTYITGYPGVRYNWTVPPEANATDVSLLTSPLFNVLQGHSGFFNCTGTNIITKKSLMVIFPVTNTVPTTTSITIPQAPIDYGLIIGVVAGIVVAVVIAVVLGILCKRGHFSKGKKPVLERSGTDQQPDNRSLRDRLLVAEECVVTHLSLRILHTTALVEYSDHSCSLNEILEKVGQAVLGSSRKFKSVALLLRPAKVGLTISEVDHAILTASSIQKEKGGKVFDFIVRLSDMCIDKTFSGARIDILNYNDKAPLRLKKGLTDVAKIPATVSSDYYGVGTPSGEKRGHATVADTYFDRNNLGEIVYAVLEQPSCKPRIQPSKIDEPVVYSKIERKA